MGIGNKHLTDKIFIFGAHAGPALTAPVLRPVSRERHPFDVTAVTDGDDHVFALDQIFDIAFKFSIFDRGPAFVAKQLFHPQ